MDLLEYHEISSFGRNSMKRKPQLSSNFPLFKSNRIHLEQRQRKIISPKEALIMHTITSHKDTIFIHKFCATALTTHNKIILPLRAQVTWQTNHLTLKMCHNCWRFTHLVGVCLALSYEGIKAASMWLPRNWCNLSINNFGRNGQIRDFCEVE